MTLFLTLTLAPFALAALAIGTAYVFGWNPWRCLAFALIAALAYPVALHAEPRQITRDRGGSIAAYVAKVKADTATGRTVEIRGRCDSACTLFLGVPNVCVHRSARLGFHGPAIGYGIGLPPQEFEYWSQVMADHYPKSIAAWFVDEARHKTMGVYTVRGAELIRHGVKECRAKMEG